MRWEQSASELDRPDLPGYEVEKGVHGAGGQSQVFLGRDLRTGAPVAIKRWERPSTRATFELRALQAVRHPNVVGVLEVREEAVSRLPCLIMSYVPWPALARELEAGPLAVERAARIAWRLADALAAVHRAGLVHRDVTPSNVLVAPDGAEPVLIDFGIATADGASELKRPTETRTGAVLGARGYLPPEQLAGGAVTGRADVFSLGVVLYECLTGRKPWRTSANHVLRHEEIQRCDGAVWSQEEGGRIPSVLRGAVTRALRFAPEDRWTAAELAEHLKAFSEPGLESSAKQVAGGWRPAPGAEPSPEPPTQPGSSIPPAPARARWSLPLLSLLVVFVGLSGFLGSWLGTGAGPAAKRAGPGLPGAIALRDSHQSLGGLQTFGLAVGDVDGDGDRDLVCASRRADEASVLWLNDGRGGFSQSPQALPTAETKSVQLGDLDGDGDLDLAFGNAGSQPNQVWLNDGEGTFSDTKQALGSGKTTAIALADVDGDGDLDLIAGNEGVGGSPNLVYLNDGAAGFSDSGQRLGQGDTLAIVVGDLDGDGDLDFVAGNNLGNQPDRAWLNDGRGTFAAGVSIGATGTRGLALADLDGDGDLDLVQGNEESSEPQLLRVYRNDGRAGFAAWGAGLGPHLTASVVVADLDGDGDGDIVAGIEGRNQLYLNDGEGHFTASPHALGVGSNRALAVGDLDGDGAPDLIVGNADRGERVYLSRR